MKVSASLEELAALQHFKRVDPVFYKVAKSFEGTLTERIVVRKTNKELFASLCTTVISQQLSTKAAASIKLKLVTLCGKDAITPQSIQATSLSNLKSVGLSGAKAKTLKEITRAVQREGLNLLQLRKVPEVEATEILTKIWGIGPWTTEMFLMFSLGSPDVFSVRDLGLRRSMEHLYKLPKDSPQEVLEEIARKWSPYRSHACLILWAHRDSPVSKKK
jgi:DNA-3-methyladenine glycosylase II